MMEGRLSEAPCCGPGFGLRSLLLCLGMTPTAHSTTVSPSNWSVIGRSYAERFVLSPPPPCVWPPFSRPSPLSSVQPHPSLNPPGASACHWWTGASMFDSPVARWIRRMGQHPLPCAFFRKSDTVISLQLKDHESWRWEKTINRALNLEGHQTNPTPHSWTGR